MEDGLVEWLRVRLDEDERVAKAAHGGDWEIAWDLLGEGETGPARIGAPTVRDPDGGEWQAPDIAQQMADADAEHVFHWQPKRALREVEAKRRILDEYEKALDRRRLFRDDVASAGALLQMVAVVKLLALPYSNRPGYPESWRS